MEKFNLFLSIAAAEEAAKENGYHISDHNRKLVPNKNTGFIIWNLPAVITCPYRTHECEIACYALKAESSYPDVLPARTDNFNRSRDVDAFIEFMTSYILTIAARGRKKEYIVRIHESGDFYNQAYADAWIQIIENVSAVTNKVFFIAYTKSFVFFDGKKLPEKLFLRASIWSDTKPEQLEIIRRNKWSTYTAVEKFTDHDTFTHCNCKDCATCGYCWSSRPDIRCEIH